MPTTIEGHIEAALFARVASFLASPVLPVAWPNKSYEGYRFLRVSHHPNRNNRLFLSGADPHQRVGFLMLSVFTPLDKGATTATELAGAVAAHFPADLELTSGPVTVQISVAPDLATALAETAHWHVPVTVRYECFA
ncbi:MAG: phage tail terminator-like protein [bacterium]|nr:phage tail terminator-like protein [bacterium]